MPRRVGAAEAAEGLAPAALVGEAWRLCIVGVGVWCVEVRRGVWLYCGSNVYIHTHTTYTY